jgi:hypothetical protein
MDQGPWNSGTRSFGMTEIVALEALIKILTGSNIAEPGLAAAQNVNVKHGEELVHRAGGIRTHDLLNPIQAFYQAELRPDLVQTIDQLQRNSERRDK